MESLQNTKLQPFAEPTKISLAPTIISTGCAVMGGAIAGGIPGALLGLTTSLADKYLIQQRYENKHYLSLTTFWSTTVAYPFFSACQALLPQTSLPIYATASLLAGLAASYFNDDFLNFEAKVNLPVDSYLTLNKFFDEKSIFSIEEAQKIAHTFFKSPLEALTLLYQDGKALYQNEFFIASVKAIGFSLFRVAVSSFSLVLLGNYAQNLFISTWIQEAQQQFLNTIIGANGATLSWSHLLTFFNHFSKMFQTGCLFLAALFTRQLAQVALQVKINNLLIEFQSLIYEKAISKILEKDHGQKILATEEGITILQSLSEDLNTLIYEGCHRVDASFEKPFEALVAFAQILSLVPTSLLPYLMGLYPLTRAFKHLGDKSSAIAEVYMKNKVKLWHFIAQITYSLDQIKLRDAEGYFKHNVINLGKIDVELTQQSEQIKVITKHVGELFATLTGFFDMVYLGFNVVSKRIHISELVLFKNCLDQLTDFLLSNQKFKLDTTKLTMASKRVNQLFDALEKQTFQLTKRSLNTQDKVIFKDYSLFLLGENLVEIDYLELDAGKRYAWTGKSGSGKSSTLFDLKQGVSKALSSQGEISVYTKDGKQASMMFLDQALYLPQNCSLLETIYFPNQLEALSPLEIEALKEKILELFIELEMEPLNEEKNDNSPMHFELASDQFQLSGGQRKKLGIIQAILTNPDILVMDEVFTGLDPNSLKKCQRALIKYLPQTLILSVDHHAEENNFDHFYHSEVHFKEKRVCQRLLAS